MLTPSAPFPDMPTPLHVRQARMAVVLDRSPYTPEERDLRADDGYDSHADEEDAWMHH